MSKSYYPKADLGDNQSLANRQVCRVSDAFQVRLEIPGRASDRLSTAVSINEDDRKSDCGGECSRVGHSGLFISLSHCRVESKRDRIRASVLDIARAFQVVHIKVGC